VLACCLACVLGVHPGILGDIVTDRAAKVLAAFEGRTKGRVCVCYMCRQCVCVNVCVCKCVCVCTCMLCVYYIPAPQQEPPSVASPTLPTPVHPSWAAHLHSGQWPRWSPAAGSVWAESARPCASWPLSRPVRGREQGGRVCAGTARSSATWLLY